MPGGDRTGPMGLGPMTGRTAGFCAGYPVPGCMNPVPGRGFRGWGRGRGGGRGRRHWYHAGLPGWGVAPGSYIASYPGYGAVCPTRVTPRQELEALQGQAEYFKDALEGIRKRITELEATAAEKK